MGRQFRTQVGNTNTREIGSDHVDSGFEMGPEAFSYGQSGVEFQAHRDPERIRVRDG